MKIALDAMGSDNFPQPDVEGALQALQAYPDIEIVLVGDQTKIEAVLGNQRPARLSIHHTPDYVSHSDTPSTVGREKPQSSMMIAANMVNTGEAQAFVTAGNTGAALSIATLYTIKRIPGVKRPMLAAVANFAGNLLVMGDIGANTDCKAEWLEQFARMGAVYAEKALLIPNPRVGLLANGEEQSKGDQTIQEAYQLLKNSSLNFVGNIEPKDAIVNGATDVVIHDGMLGNVFLKTMEAFGSVMFKVIRKELTADLRAKVGGGLAKPAFKRVYRRVDPFEIGGTLLLGVNGVVIVGHGRTNALGIKNSIRQAREALHAEVVPALSAAMRQDRHT